MDRTVTLNYLVPWQDSELVFDKEAWVVVKSKLGLHGVWHRHDDKYGGGRNRPPYLSRAHHYCGDCAEPIPDELKGFLNLLNWVR